MFGAILTLLIALEFNHILQYVVKREQSIIQTKIVLLIALLAISSMVVARPPACQPA
jgi:Phosphate-starvation-inducible E family